MSNVRMDFVTATHSLAIGNAASWQAFMYAFSEYVALKLEEGVGSSPEMAQVMLGRSKAFIELRDEFRKIHETFTKLHNHQPRR